MICISMVRTSCSFPTRTCFDLGHYTALGIDEADILEAKGTKKKKGKKIDDPDFAVSKLMFYKA
jgi:histone-lysine N-methyltransferase SETD2